MLVRTAITGVIPQRRPENGTPGTRGRGVKESSGECQRSGRRDAGDGTAGVWIGGAERSRRGINLNVVRQALSQYQFDGAPRLLVHLPTVIPTAHKSTLSRTFSNEYARHFAGLPLTIADEDGKLRPEVEALIYFARHHDIVISSGHATKDQTLRLIEAVERVGVVVLC
jgi:hypothetical protein